MVVRCTAKVLTLVGVRRSSLPELPAAAEDWYVNLLWVDRRKSLLVTHALTAFSAFIPDVRKAHLQPPGPLLAAAITDALAAENLPAMRSATSTGSARGWRPPPAAGCSG